MKIVLLPTYRYIYFDTNKNLMTVFTPVVTAGKVNKLTLVQPILVKTYEDYQNFFYGSPNLQVLTELKKCERDLESELCLLDVNEAMAFSKRAWLKQVKKYINLFSRN